MVWRSPCGLTELAFSPENLLGLLVRKSDSVAKVKIPLGSVKLRRLSCIRSTAPPNFKEWVPCVQKASSYPWNEFQKKRKKLAPFRPPGIGVSPGTNTWDAKRPGIAAREGSAARGLMAETLSLLFTLSRLKPKRALFTKVGLKMWVSSR